MVYNNKIVAVVKCNGRIIREDGDIVRLPYNAEYSILLKNLSMTKALVGVQIDGNDVLSNSKIIIPSNSSHELIGFINSNNEIKNRFKFIKKTEKIAKHRGDNIDDGIINIDFQFEKQPVAVTYITNYPTSGYYWSYQSPVLFGSSNIGASSGGCSSGGVTSSNYVDVYNSSMNNDEGITVKGSQTSKQYSYGSINYLEEEHDNIILRLKGTTDFVYTNTKFECETCGRKCKSNMKFCPECGTSLL